MEFDRIDNPEAEAALTAGHKEKKTKRRRKAKAPVALKAGEKKPAESKSLRDTWEELVTKKHDKKTEKRSKKKHEIVTEPIVKKAKEQTTEAPEEEHDKKTDEPIEIIEAELYEEFEIPLSENIEAEISLRPNPDAQELHNHIRNGQIGDSEQKKSAAIIEPWAETVTPTQSVAETSTGPINETDIPEATTSPEPANYLESLAGDQSQDVTDIISQVHEAYADTNPIDKALFSELVDEGGSGGYTLSETKTPTKTHQASSTESLFAEPLNWRQRDKVKKIVRSQQRDYETKIEDLGKSQKHTQKELTETRAQGLSNEEYWRHKLANQPMPFETNKSGKASPILAEKRPIEAQEVMERMQLSPEHHIEQSAWHSIEVDNKTGRAVERPSVITYGEAFRREQRQEALGQEEPEEVAAASGQLAVGTSANIDLPEPVSSSSHNPLNTPTLLGAANNTIRLGRGMTDSSGDLWLWLILALVVIAIIATLKF